MPNIQINSPDWTIRRKATSRGSTSADAVTASEFPREFLTDDSEVAEEFVAQPKTTTRGESVDPGALDFSYELGAGEAAILSIRHPSGALTFHVPVQSASRSLRQPNQVRFVVTVRSTDVRRENAKSQQGDQSDSHQGRQGCSRQGHKFRAFKTGRRI